MGGNLSPPTFRYLLDGEMSASEDLPGLPPVRPGRAAKRRCTSLPARCGPGPCAARAPVRLPCGGAFASGPVRCWVGGLV